MSKRGNSGSRTRSRKATTRSRSGKPTASAHGRSPEPQPIAPSSSPHVHSLHAAAPAEAVPPTPPSDVAAAALAEASELGVVPGALDATPRYFSEQLREWAGLARAGLRQPWSFARKLASRLLHTLLPHPGHPHRSH